MLRVALWTGPGAHGQRHRTLGMAADRAPPAGRIPAIDADQRAPIPPRLVLKLPDELRPTRVGNGFRQTAVALHVAHGKALDGDHLVLADHPGRELVQEIPARVRDARMHARDFQLQLASVLRAGPGPRHAALVLRQGAFVLPERLGRGDLLAVRYSDKVRQAEIDTDLAFNRWLGRHGVVAPQRGEVPARGVP